MGILPWHRQFGQLESGKHGAISINQHESKGIRHPRHPMMWCLRRCSLGVLLAAYYAAHVPAMHGEKLLRAEKPQSCKFRKQGNKDSC